METCPTQLETAPVSEYPGAMKRLAHLGWQAAPGGGFQSHHLLSLQTIRAGAAHLHVGLIKSSLKLMAKLEMALDLTVNHPKHRLTWACSVGQRVAQAPQASELNVTWI